VFTSEKRSFDVK